MIDDFADTASEAPNFESRIERDPHGQWQLAAAVIAASNARSESLALRSSTEGNH